MNNATLKRSIVSPFQIKRVGFQEHHPAKEEIKKNLKEITLTAIFQEDKHSLENLNVPNLIAFLCILKQGQQIIAEGRGMSVLGKTTKWIERGVSFARSQSLLDAVAKSSKVLEALQTNENERKENSLGSAYRAVPEENEESITDRQRSYLIELINLHTEDEIDRDRWLSQIETMSKTDASEAIAEFANR